MSISLLAYVIFKGNFIFVTGSTPFFKRKQYLKGTPLASGNVFVALKTIYQEGGISGVGLWNQKRGVQAYAGATAGLCVDVVLYPIDTLKTRLQSASGNVFTSCGKLKLFAGLPMVLLGSAPASAVFFYFYEVAKEVSQKNGLPMWASSMIGTTAADIDKWTGHFVTSIFAVEAPHRSMFSLLQTSMVLWVPCENVKQSAQSRPFDSLRSIFRSYVQHEGWIGLYRGYVSTIVRDLPCALIQFPIWEALKGFFARRNHRRLLEQHLQGGVAPHSFPPPSAANLTGFQFALCGFLSGAIAGSVTTPLDVAKTRIMLAERDSVLASGRISTALKLVYKETGILGWFAGILPRVGLMSLGGGIFLGLYDITRSFLEPTLDSSNTKPKP
ncbi:hypothetical protein ACTXT7_007797 [Hymenolepis weldensis]